MKYVFLDGETIASPAALHEAFSEALGFPAYTGKNLDALHDALTELREPVGVIAVNCEGLKAALGRRWKPFLRLMEDLGGETGLRFLADPFESP